MSALNDKIAKSIHEIQFNGCKLPESILKLHFETIVSLAKLEQAQESNQMYLESLKLDTAHGHGGNDVPNVIGQHITEPSDLEFINPITN